MGRCGLAYLALGGGLALVVGASKGDDRSWNQEAARRKVEEALRIEAVGRPWDDIAWEIDPSRAADRARREDKPLLVYFYLAKPVGPPAAPC